MNERPILLPGTRTRHNGRVGAVLWTGGERYYLLIDDDGVVSLMPADVVESVDDTPGAAPEAIR